MTSYATKPKTKLTPHQLEVLQLIIVANVDSDPSLVAADLDQVLERVGKQTSKQAMQFTIRALVTNEMIVKGERSKRRGRMRATYEATQQGREVGEEKPPSPCFVEASEPEFDSKWLTG